MFLLSLYFSEEVGQMQLGWHILKSNGMLIKIRPSKESIDINMLGKFMLHRIIGNLYSSCIII
jgi:hypothetical protein